MLVRGVDWSTGQPRLAYQQVLSQNVVGQNVVSQDTVDGALPLTLGSTLGFKVLDGRRHCLGFSTVPGPTSAFHTRCPSGALAERGYQCGPCFARDDFRYMHDFHRGGTAPEGLRAYLAQPHWLYIASFANGASKVGTASQLRKTVRLAEQGAVTAQYVAEAEDGRIVRMLEDSVSEGLGLPQQVRSATKLSSLTQPWSLVAIQETNQATASRVREHLNAVGLPGFSVVEELWQPSPLAAGLTSSAQREPYPLTLDGGEHGLPLNAMLGPFAVAELEGTDFVLNLGELKGKLIELGEFHSELPARQTSLF
ncbi:hypothetical protein FHU41_001574 [Psychromicrobium silvestre]|uniref:DUF2797 domain-containing protein n=1 Tax=Psychromicrobium silvestre TaxID=1645614 RepID=A0A7Y9LTL4_9MICC|nr:DUF2797 domain-containing protein [Psychromicrobium silvestre]NYE95353.1 hypothetical protein [Psychromicrobium silvestre]